MSESILKPAKSKNPEADTHICWELAIRRVTDAKRDDEVKVPDALMELGIDIAARAAVLSKVATDTESKAVLAKLFAGRIYTPLNVAARVNSLFAFYELTDNSGKQVKLAVLDKALRGLHTDPVAPIDYSAKSLYAQSKMLLEALFALTGKYSQFEHDRLVAEDTDAIYLNRGVQALLKQHPERHAAIVELIGNRRIDTTRRVLEMLDASQANAMMDGAL
jgi:hypothetical protein